MSRTITLTSRYGYTITLPVDIILGVINKYIPATVDTHSSVGRRGFPDLQVVETADIIKGLIDERKSRPEPPGLDATALVNENRMLLARLAEGDELLMKAQSEIVFLDQALRAFKTIAMGVVP